MNDAPKFTHRGWFWFCPIYFATDSEGLVVEARRPWMEPLFSLALSFEAARIWLCTLLSPDYGPAFWFVETGELDT